MMVTPSSSYWPYLAICFLSVAAQIVTAKGSCLSSPCLNGGTCIDVISPSSAPTPTPSSNFNCTCEASYEGLQCQEIKTVVRGNCRYHVKYGGAQMTFSSANSTCTNLNGTLAMIKSLDLQDALEQQLLTQYGSISGTVELWVGGHKINGIWYWIDGTKIPMSGSNQKWWSSSIDFMTLSSLASTISDMRWHSRNSYDTAVGYMCEIPISDPCKNANCSGGGTCFAAGCQANCVCWPGFEGNNCEIGPCSSSPCMNGGECSVSSAAPYYNCTCKASFEGPRCEDRKFFTDGDCKYHVNQDNQTDFAGANSTCASLGGALVTIKSNRTQLFLETAVKSVYGNVGQAAFWTSGSKVDGSWRWGDSTKIGGIETAFTQWAPGYPSNRDKDIYIVISSSTDIRWDTKAPWFKLDWLNVQASIMSGFICENAVNRICAGNECKNGGSCAEIGCQKICNCMPGYSGKYCQDDHLQLQPNQTNYKVETGEKVTITLNITSKDGPVDVQLSNESGTPSRTPNVVGLVDFTLEPIWEIGIWMRYEFSASPVGSQNAYTRTAFVNVYVKKPQTPGSVKTEICRTDVTVSFSAAEKAVGLNHRITVIRTYDSSKKTYDVTPRTTAEIQRKFTNLQSSTEYTVDITVCRDLCTPPSSIKKVITMPAAIPYQVVQYLLVTQKNGADVCRLRWSTVDTKIQDVKIIAKWEQVSSGQSSEGAMTLSGSKTQLDYKVQPDRTYSFTIQATTCAGLSPSAESIGDCITGNGSAANSSQAPTALAAFFGVFFFLSVGAHVALFLIRKRKAENAAPKDVDDDKGKVGPYLTTFFDGPVGEVEEPEGYEVPIKLQYADSEFDDDDDLPPPEAQECPYHYDNDERRYENEEESRPRKAMIPAAAPPKANVYNAKPSQPKEAIRPVTASHKPKPHNEMQSRPIMPAVVALKPKPHNEKQNRPIMPATAALKPKPHNEKQSRPIMPAVADFKPKPHNEKQNRPIVPVVATPKPASQNEKQNRPKNAFVPPATATKPKMQNDMFTARAKLKPVSSPKP